MTLTFKDLEEEFSEEGYDRRETRGRVLRNLANIRNLSDHENRLLVLHETNATAKKDFVYRYLKENTRFSPLDSAPPMLSDSRRRIYDRTMKKTEYADFFTRTEEYRDTLLRLEDFQPEDLKPEVYKRDV